MQELRANTEVKVKIGPAVAVGDGFTPVTTLDLSTADEAELFKHDSAAVTSIAAATFAAIANADGWYNLTLTTALTDTEGLLDVIINDDSLILPLAKQFMVLSEAAWDSKYVAKDDGFMDVNIKTIGRADTQETEATNLEAACANYSATRGLTGTALPAAAANAAGGVPISTAGGLDLDAKLANTNEVTVARMGALTDWINGGRLDLIIDDILTDTGTTLQAELDGIQADTEDIQARLPAALVNSRMDCTIDGTGMETGAVDSILNRDATASTTNSTLGAIINDWENGGRLDLIIDDILTDTGTTLDGKIDAVDNFVDTEIGTIITDIAAVKADTAAILADTGTDGVVLANDAITSAKIAANAIGASELAADAATEIGAAVWAVANIAPSAIPAATATMLQAMSYWLHVSITTHEVSATEHRVRNTADNATIATHGHSDDGVTFQSDTGV